MRLAAFLVIFSIFSASPLLAAELPAQGGVSLINFSDDHCMPCKMMSRLVAKIADDYSGQVAAQTVNALEDREAARKYAVKTLPTLVFFSHNGEEALRHVGVMDEAAMREALDRLLAE